MWLLYLIVLAGVSYWISNVQSSGVRGWLGALFAAIFLIGLQGFLISQARGRKPNLKFFDLIVTSEDNFYSLSRFQIYIWTIWVVIAFAYVAFASCSFPTIPENVAILMGINGFTTVLSSAIVDRTKLKASTDPPDFYKNIFLDAKGTLDLPRTQMFIWTIVILAVHMYSFWCKCQSGNPSIPEVSGGLLILMGVSNGAYLGVKHVDEKNKP
jgi:hypothetical protein